MSAHSEILAPLGAGGDAAVRPAKSEDGCQLTFSPTDESAEVRADACALFPADHMRYVCRLTD